MEKKLRWIGPALLWGSIFCAILHFFLHIVHRFVDPAGHTTERVTVVERTMIAAEKTFVAAEKTLVAAEKTLVAAERSFEKKAADTLKPADTLKLPANPPTKAEAAPPAKEAAETKGAAAEVSAEKTHDASPTIGKNAAKHPDGGWMYTLVPGMFLLALAAAILPAVAAGVRTCRGAFEFGRNSLRFESMSHRLEHLLADLAKAKSPEAILVLLRRGEYAMEDEHRAWMRLMMEAEWIG